MDEIITGNNKTKKRKKANISAHSSYSIFVNQAPVEAEIILLSLWEHYLASYFLGVLNLSKFSFHRENAF